MLAVIQKSGDAYVARFERHLKHSVEKVWAALTENGQLQKWFAELSVEDLREGGLIRFDMQDGTFEEMRILELKLYEVLEYEWGDDRVRFELYPEPDGCKLVLIENITKLTDHSPKDLAGWHVCLRLIATVLDGRELDLSDSEWEMWYKAYAPLVEQLRV